METLVKDSKSQIQHHLNKETGESYITYKVVYLLQDINDPRLQRKITKAEAVKIAKGIGLNISDIPECFNWSTLGG